MKNLPAWIKKILDSENLTCGRCDNSFDKEELVSIGIQKSSRSPQKEILFIGIVCNKCKEMTIFELQEMTLLDLSVEVLEEQSESYSRKKKKELDKEIGTKNNSRNKPRIIRSKITRKEIKDSVNFLNNINNHEEFLVALGMSLDEIEGYNIKKKTTKRKKEDNEGK